MWWGFRGIHPAQMNSMVPGTHMGRLLSPKPSLFNYFVGISSFPGKLQVTPASSLWPSLFPLVAALFCPWGECLRWEGPPHRQRRSGLQSNPEAWRHVKNDDSYTFWKDFGLLENNSRGLFGVCFWHGPQGRPKACPKALKRCLMISQRCPKVTQRVPKLTQRTHGTPKCSQNVSQDLPKGA